MLAMLQTPRDGSHLVRVVAVCGELQYDLQSLPVSFGRAPCDKTHMMLRAMRFVVISKSGGQEWFAQFPI